jgi:hypothetical protein
VVLVATVAAKGSGLIAEIKRHPGATALEVTRRGRDEVPRQIAEWVRSGPRGR